MNIIQKIKEKMKPEYEFMKGYTLVSAVPIQSDNTSKGGKVESWTLYSFEAQMYDERKDTFAKAAMNVLMNKASEIIESYLEALHDPDKEPKLAPDLASFSVIRRGEHQYDLVRRTDKGDVVVLSATDNRWRC
jgi:hypothetical protein